MKNKLLLILGVMIILQSKYAYCRNIFVPGYEILNFSAGHRTQKVNFRNPDENSCSFKITLFLENGQAIWSSDVIPPGKTLTTIELNRELERGRYHKAIMKYECFTLDDRVKLNNVEIILNINVN